MSKVGDICRVGRPVLVADIAITTNDDFRGLTLKIKCFNSLMSSRSSLSFEFMSFEVLGREVSGQVRSLGFKRSN